jgi:hypothetical protein
MDIQPSENALRLTALVTENAGEPTIIYDDSAALCVAVVERAGAGLLSLAWDVPGLYILLDPISSDGTWGSYVGKAPAGLRSRLQTHVKQKDHWSRALLISRQTHDGFNSAQVGWLESRFYDLLDSATFAVPHNGNRPSDETLPTYERATLENCVLPVTRLLRLLGYDPSAPGDEPATGPKNKHSYYGVKLSQLVNAGVVGAGSQLVSINSGWPATAMVAEDGTVTVGNDSFGTPSAAATAVTGGPVNGWDFWALEEEDERVPLSVLRKRFIDGSQEGVK